MSTAIAIDTDAHPRVLDPSLLADAQRQLDICLACRYCEGLCAVFPALERRAHVTESDALFLANLCHDCRSCYDACPFAAPHEFAVDIPPLMARLRESTYAAYAAPRAVNHRAGKSGRLAGAWPAAAAFVTVVAAAVAYAGWGGLVTSRSGPGSFYEVVPWAAMTVPAAVLAGLAVVSMAVGVVRFWRHTAGRRRVDARSLKVALRDAATLRHMRGGGPGCTYPEDMPDHRRVLYHSLVFYGFLATFLATTLAAIWQEGFGRLPPYSATSLPVLFGIVGGLAAVAGCIGLLVLKRSSRDHLHGPTGREMDLEFIVMLLLVNASGMALLLARSTTAMGLLLVVHLGLVAGFFVGLPYGKFVHALYRSAALTQNALESAAEADAAAG